MSNWGTILDRAWALEGVAICGLGISVLPAMWTLSNSFWWIVGLQVWSGHVWAGFEVLSVLLVQRMFPHVIVRALAVTFAAGTAGSAIGGLVGGQLLEWGLSIPQLFRVSSIVRFSAVLSLLMYLRMQGAFRFRTLRIPESARELLSLQPTKRAARSLRTTMSWLLLGRQ
jgi:MFS family permease